MIRRSFRIGLWLGVVAALGYMVVRTRQRSKPAALPAPESGSWPPIEAKPVAPSAPVATPVAEPADDEAEASEPAPKPAVKAASKPKAKAASKRKAKTKSKAKAADAGDRAWVEPSGKTCPSSHPLKANESSKIFHPPDGLSYERTRPDRCYANEAAAESDGYRKARR